MRFEHPPSFSTHFSDGGNMVGTRFGGCGEAGSEDGMNGERGGHRKVTHGESANGGDHRAGGEHGKNGQHGKNGTAVGFAVKLRRLCNWGMTVVQSRGSGGREQRLRARRAAIGESGRWRLRGKELPSSRTSHGTFTPTSLGALTPRGEETVLAVELREITVENWEECIALRVSEAQRGMVASNVYSLAQAKVQPECVPLAVYADDTMVGFVMYALDRDDGNWWIYRLMIDERYQGRGYGRAALRCTIGRIRQEPVCPRIMISLKPDNVAARALYRSEGFVETGQRIGGEDVLCLTLT